MKEVPQRFLPSLTARFLTGRFFVSTCAVQPASEQGRSLSMGRSLDDINDGPIMATEGETKPCTRKGCNGVMKFSFKAKAPGSRVGSEIDEGRISWENRPQAGWICDKNPDHFDPK
jgi:hypothetical protein